MSAVVVTSIAGADIIAILSRPEYASYYYVLPVLLFSLVLVTSYRLFELIANAHFKQHLFFWLWPLSALAAVAIYSTVRSYGMLSVLLWPIAEIILRIGILNFLLRGYAVWRTFDPSRSILIILSAVIISLCLFALRLLLPLHFRHSDLILGALGLITFLTSFFILRPLRPTECEALVTAMPASLSTIRRIALMASREQFGVH